MVAMLWYLQFLVLVLVAVSSAVEWTCGECQPEQIHIAFGEIPNDIVITWNTMNDTESSVVTYGVGGLTETAMGNSTEFIENGKHHRSQYVHRVTLRDLQYNTTYEYNVGSPYGYSELFSFHVPPEGQKWAVRAAIFGDMGVENAHSLPFLQKEAEEGNFDLMLHVGDFAYDMDNHGSTIGDRFMRQIQPMAALVPYMTCVGNHECDVNYDFLNYRARFSMPGDTESMFYSFNLGPVHFVALSTEYYYEGDHKMVPMQYSWLIQDLTEANTKENRLLRPWIVLFGHRPMYCSIWEEPYELECGNETTRTGLPGVGFGLEKVLKEYGVDIVIWAHIHAYERLWPIYDRKVYNGSLAEPYTDPGAPVHIITGSAGCKEDLDPFNNTQPPWSAFRRQAYGYTRFVAHNHSHVYMEQLDVQAQEVIDSVWVVKHSHGPYHYD